MPAGRPTKFKPEYIEQAAKLCALGATDSELASFFKVAVSTVALWKVEHAEFAQALRMSKADADRRVEESLYRRALGYECDETDIRVVGNKIVKTSVRKHYPPDTVAMIFWLKNRRPDEWRDVREVKMSRDIKELTHEELLAIAAGSSNGAPAAGSSSAEPGPLH